MKPIPEPIPRTWKSRPDRYSGRAIPRPKDDLGYPFNDHEKPSLVVSRRGAEKGQGGIEPAFHWPRIIVAGVIIYGMAALCWWGFSGADWLVDAVYQIEGE